METIGARWLSPLLNYLNMVGKVPDWPEGALHPPPMTLTADITFHCGNQLSTQALSNLSTGKIHYPLPLLNSSAWAFFHLPLPWLFP